MKQDHPLLTEQTAAELFHILVQYCPENWSSLTLYYEDADEGVSMRIQAIQGQDGKPQPVALEEADADAIMQAMERAIPFGEEGAPQNIAFTINPDGEYELQF